MLKKLTRSHVAAQRAVRELLDKRTVVRIAQQMVQVVSDEFLGVQGFADRMAAVAEKISATIANTLNDGETELGYSVPPNETVFPRDQSHPIR